MKNLNLELKSSEWFSLNGRIDFENAGKVYEEITAYRKAHPEGALILNCDGLNYLSSAGLRTFLRLQKREKKKIILKNVKPEILEILTTTGFHKIMQVEPVDANIQLPNGRIIEKISNEFAEQMAELSPEDLNFIDSQLREIDIEGCEIIGRGTTGMICRLGKEDIVKVFNKGFSLDAVIREVMVSKKAFVRGLPTAISYDVVKAGGCYGAVFEMIGGETLADAMHREPENLASYEKEYAALFRAIHQTRVEEAALPSAKKNFLAAAKRCTKYYSAKEIDLIQQVIAGIPDRNTLIHRDYHSKNIMVTNGKLILIDMADVCIGHPIFDWMGIMATHQFFPNRFPKETAQNTGMSLEECNHLRESLFRLYFAEKSDAEINEIEKQAERFSKVLLGISPALREEQAEIINAICVQEAREQLLPYAKEMIGAINW